MESVDGCGGWFGGEAWSGCGLGVVWAWSGRGAAAGLHNYLGSWRRRITQRYFRLHRWQFDCMVFDDEVRDSVGCSEFCDGKWKSRRRGGWIDGGVESGPPWKRAAAGSQGQRFAAAGNRRARPDQAQLHSSSCSLKLHLSSPSSTINCNCQHQADPLPKLQAAIVDAIQPRVLPTGTL